jgi:alpha,alpha-trehalose phosphorylase
MAQRNLVGAADMVGRFPDGAQALGVDPEEVAGWRDAALAMHLPYDDEIGVHQQAEGFTRQREWDFDATGPDQYPLNQHFAYFDLYSRQVIKQADLVLAMHWRGDAFTDDEKARNFAYYDARTVRDSTLSACTQSVIAAEVGHLELAHDYLTNAALMGLHDPERDTHLGVDVSSVAGVWLALVAGFGGMRDHHGQLSFAPRLPSRIGRLEFSILWRGQRLKVLAHPHDVVYALSNGGADAQVELLHHGVPVIVTGRRPVTMACPAATPPTSRPAQPAGRTLPPRGTDGERR